MLFLCLLVTALPAMSASLAVVNAAAYTSALAPETIATAFGPDLAVASGPATTVTVRDSSGSTRTATLFYSAPQQISFLIPTSTAVGAAIVTVASGDGVVSTASVQITAVAPGLFSANANGQGVASAFAVQGTNPNASPVFSCGTAALSCVPLPLMLNQTVLELYGTGIRGHSATGVTCTVGGVSAPVLYAGAQGQYPGLDQVNVSLPASLAAQGQLNVVLTVDGQTANTVTVNTGAPGNLFVAPNGNDTWTGTLPAPNSAATDGPFATIARAQQAVRAMLKNSQNTASIIVMIRAGTYYLSQPLEFNAADSGTASSPVIWQNYPGETPRISGGIRITNWTNTAGNRWQATLPPSTPYFENLFYDGQRRLRPRLGSYLGPYLRFAGPVYLSGSAPPAKAPTPNCSIYVSGKGWECFDRFLYNAADAVSASWQNLAPPAGNACGAPAGNPAIVGDIELTDFEFFTVPKLRVSCIDTTNHIVYLTGPTAIQATDHGFYANHRYLFENIEDALTQPGQWFLDRSAASWTLTYLANTAENPNTDTVVIPRLPQVLVASGLQYVTFQGLSFAHDNFIVPPQGHVSVQQEVAISAAVSCQNCQHVTLDSIVVSQTSGAGLEIISCTNAMMSPSWCVSVNANSTTANNVVQNSAFYELGASGIRVAVLNAPTDTDANVPQFTLVQNNVIEGYGRVFPAAFGIAQGDAHDNLYTHNDIYDGYHAAISVCAPPCSPGRSNSNSAFNNTISFNHVYNLLQGIMDDGGSLYFATGGPTFAAAGNRMLNNKVHDVSDASAVDSDGYGGNGLYLDNMSAMIDVENNLVYRVSDTAMYVTQAPAMANQPHTIRNNIFAFGRLAMIANGNPYPSNTCPANPIMVFTAADNLVYFDRTKSSTPPFYAQHGCTYSCGFPYNDNQVWQTNLYWRDDGSFANDPDAFHIQPKPGGTSLCGGTPTWQFLDFHGWQAMGEDSQSLIANPGFANPVYPNDDFSLPGGSPLAGFVVFDPNQAGRSNPIIMPPSVLPGFVTAPFNPAKDY